ncbi:glycosyl hydrolase 5 family protein-like [Vitis riparia]|uniref:glycosyl hydrolase 5 family protein-like n=1 Tax=Vitis riparia TaxID=96939 RepID=UPI00155A4DEA|nr:glycosyl hydrolase 5 family protein-like [Vitis riparia]
MEMIRGTTLKTLLLISLSVVATLSVCESLPLSTKGRWIVDDVTGRRVKLKCVNWISHTESTTTKGLHSQPIGDIADKINEMGFNCVRLTYPTFLWTRVDYYNKTVAESLDSLNVTEAKAMIAVQNPRFLSLPLRESYERVVGELGRRGLMLILDNHVSKPMWCCEREDGNGFFGDKFFDPGEWIEGLSQVANRFKDESHVIGMSMRNELRGQRSNQKDWYKYMREGAKAIHSINPNLLVVVSGLNFDNDLSFLKKKPFGLTLNNKVVFEAHWYSFDATEQWNDKPPEQECKDRAREFYRDAGFLTEGDNPAPLFISEFGMDLRMGNVADNRYFNCYLPTVAAKDLDWALWTLQASYYYRQRKRFTQCLISTGKSLGIHNS